MICLYTDALDPRVLDPQPTDGAILDHEPRRERGDGVAIGLELGRLVLGVGLDRRAVTDVQSVAGARDHGVDDAVGVLGDLARRGGSFDGEADPIWHFAGSPVAEIGRASCRDSVW